MLPAERQKKTVNTTLKDNGSSCTVEDYTLGILLESICPEPGRAMRDIAEWRSKP
jgi:hypothetical protein